MKAKASYDAPKLTSYGAVRDITRDCDIPPLADVHGGEAGTACPPGS